VIKSHETQRREGSARGQIARDDEAMHRQTDRQDEQRMAVIQRDLLTTIPTPQQSSAPSPRREHVSADAGRRRCTGPL
jgi:hypothetical protein